ncbi:M1 family metallopeptidase [Flavobacteriaceae bacterium XHP0103]|uniref:M1 family metallopeptidase n=1 Tax=Marixanthotalea marina TaxID=2844359 RepID=UPI002989E957|nr:M1 family metallopeptidase [Marixanthotalea marina]MBU3820594.1 M1 family metallopeptidase [Marixanthotalea marina]
MYKFFIYTVGLAMLFTSCKSIAQPTETQLSSNQSGYWQQHVDYTMAIDMDVNTYQYKGTQQLVYTNNSPDVLDKVFYHLYLNAFQPGSEMDVRARTIADPDKRMGDRISKLQPNEIGYINVNALKQNGTDITYKTVGTILVVDLAKPIQPGEKVTFDMDFDAQVPVQIRRTGRNNVEGVALSMAQWYPKMAEYDTEGWHTHPYIAREFYGVWGNFDVKITIDKNYVIGGTGYLQNPNEIGHGYETGPVNRPNTDKLTWHFVAPNVHDFTWAADPDYIHDTIQVTDGPLMHFFYKGTMPKEKLENWKKIQPKAVEFMQYYSEHIGKYPYKQYSIIQGGDGGMEYGMCTLILGEGTYEGMIKGTISHEMAHSWFQFLLATNESKHPWMDEGFATYVEYRAVNTIFNEGKENPLENVYKNYIYLANSGREQPLTTQGDRYDINAAYSIASYYKGCVFLAQLGYIMGENNLQKTIKKYFTDFAFKHPTPRDIIRTAEKVSGLQLDWYLTDFAQTTNKIDYGVKSVEGNTVTLERIGLMPMPIDLRVTYTDGTTEDFYIPLRMMLGKKPTTATIKEDWPWAFPTYTLETTKTIQQVEIDPKQGMTDVNRANNTNQL